MLDNRTRTFETLLEMKDHYAVTASTFASDGGVAKEWDTGGGYTEGMFVADIGTLGTAAGLSANFSIVLQGSLNSSFSTNVDLAIFHIGQADYLGSAPCTNATYLDVYAAGDYASNKVAQGTGRYHMPFTNDLGGTIYRYLRVFTLVGGATTGTIGYGAFITKP